MAGERWPRWVYGVGEEPDPRFTFANERTFLAWIRTALALLAAGVAVEAFVTGGNAIVRRVLAAALVVLGLVSGAAAYRRWMAAERALRTAEPLPAPKLAPLIGYGVALAGLLALGLVLVSR